MKLTPEQLAELRKYAEISTDLLAGPTLDILDHIRAVDAERDTLADALRPFAEAWAKKLLWDADSTARHPHVFTADNPCNSDPAAAILWKWDAFKAAHDALEGMK